jgi:hypothetical protein
MKTELIAFAAAIGIAFAAPAAGFAHDGQAPASAGKLESGKSKTKRPATPRAEPEAAGGTLERAKIVFF